MVARCRTAARAETPRKAERRSSEERAVVTDECEAISIDEEASSRVAFLGILFSLFSWIPAHFQEGGRLSRPRNARCPERVAPSLVARWHRAASSHLDVTCIRLVRVQRAAQVVGRPLRSLRRQNPPRRCARVPEKQGSPRQIALSSPHPAPTRQRGVVARPRFFGCHVRRSRALPAGHVASTARALRL